MVSHTNINTGYSSEKGFIERIIRGRNRLLENDILNWNEIKKILNIEERDILYLANAEELNLKIYDDERQGEGYGEMGWQKQSTLNNQRVTRSEHQKNMMQFNVNPPQKSIKQEYYPQKVYKQEYQLPKIQFHNGTSKKPEINDQASNWLQQLMNDEKSDTISDTQSDVEIINHKEKVDEVVDPNIIGRIFSKDSD